MTSVPAFHLPQILISSISKCVNSSVLQTVPSDYVRAHGSKFDNWVALSYNGGRANWKVKVNVNVINNREHVAFGAGWKHFADCHAIVEGEWLKFEIVSRSCFEVTRAR